MRESRIFKQNRAMGFVSNHIPATARYFHKRKQTVIVTCVGRSFHTYESGRFRLICSSPLHDAEITCIAADPFLVYCAAGNTIYGWRSGRTIKKRFENGSPVTHLLPFGPHLISVDEANRVKIWALKTGELYLELTFDAATFRVSALLHPNTYVNKILLGSEQGGLQLWNIRKGELIHTFNAFDSRVMVLEQAPAENWVAIGLQTGRIVIFNLLTGETKLEFVQTSGAVVSLAFRSDNVPIMASGDSAGQITFWHLEEERVASTLRAHDAAVTTLRCFQNEPLMLTTSPDNSMKLWVFDMPDGGARLLKLREGHAAPPVCVRFHNRVKILSAGEDSSLRIFHTVSETLNRSMGRASYNRKVSKRRGRSEADPLLMPPVVLFESRRTREKDWDNVAAVHRDLQMVTTWSSDRGRMGDHKLVPEEFRRMAASSEGSRVANCLALTHCGNFVVIGYASGHVFRFNVQSGIQRAQYGKPAHKGAVHGVAVDNLNQTVISGGSDGVVRFWEFKGDSDTPLASLDLEEGITMFRTHSESSMLCVVLEDFSISIIDYDTRIVARRFLCAARITDACFSPDSRWLLVASMDCSLRVFDIPSAYLIDHFRTAVPCISLSFSPGGDFLATAHVDYLGVYLWSNKTLFNHISLRPLPADAEPALIDLPAYSQPDPPIAGDETEDVKEEDYTSPETLDFDLLTLSDLPASRWQHLLVLDVCKKRNKPRAPPKAPKSAPFFLPTVAGLEMKFDLSAARLDVEQSKVVKATQVESLTKFGGLLKATVGHEDFGACVEHLKSLSPSALDFEIKLLSQVGEESTLLMLQFLRLIVAVMRSNRNFELAQAWLSVFLKSHQDVIVQTPELADYLEEVEIAQRVAWEKLEKQLLYGCGVVGTLKNFAISTN